MYVKVRKGVVNVLFCDLCGCVRVVCLVVWEQSVLYELVGDRERDYVLPSVWIGRQDLR